MSVHSHVPDENVRARLTARAGAARADNSRVGFTPKDTSAAFYIYTMVRGPAPLEPGGSLDIWTEVKR
jgi:hypothetical protein